MSQGGLRQTQNALVLKHLRRSTLTSWQAITQYGITRLAARIRNLRDEGHLIKSRIVCEHGKRYARYLLVH